MNNLTVLSFGGGQDSTAILLKIITDADFRARYVKGHLIVVMSDTGDEHPYTYNHVEKIKQICIQEKIPFFMLTSDMGFHTPAWQDLITPQLRGDNEKFKPTMVQLGTKSCTDKLKLGPIYKFLDEYINEKMEYNFPTRETRGCSKKAIKKFAQENNKIRVLIGFSKGEEKRADKAMKLQAKLQSSKKDTWGRSLDRIFPLIEIGMDRQGCQEFITRKIGYCPLPSNCMRCPYMSDHELLWLWRNYPAKFKEWELIEQRKLKRYEGIEKNHGVYNNKKTLADKLNNAIKKYGHWSNVKLDQYKLSHGCQTNSM